jgi:hypothetical protein
MDLGPICYRLIKINFKMFYKKPFKIIKYFKDFFKKIIQKNCNKMKST